MEKTVSQMNEETKNQAGGDARPFKAAAQEAVEQRHAAASPSAKTSQPGTDMLA